MKRFILILLLAVAGFGGAATGYAGVQDDYEEAAKLRLAAGACLAAYNARTGMLAREYFRQDGWEIRPFVKSSKEADARFLLARKMSPAGRPRYLLAVVGTETWKDLQVDLRTGKVYFAGRTPEEFAANARRADMPDSAPKVHRGFYEYMQAALANKAPDDDGGGRELGELLLADGTAKVYLVGHSLGGAVATLIGARLLAMGVKPAQIEVITFGAPAVGNAAFARAYEPQLNLTRVVISGDAVTGVLQQLVGGYKQFGRELLWQQSPLFSGSPHAVEEYLDLAIKRFYDARKAARQAGAAALPAHSPVWSGPQVYVAPLVKKLPAVLAQEGWYMEQAVADEYRRLLPGYVPGGPPDADPRERAAATRQELEERRGRV